MAQNCRRAKDILFPVLPLDSFTSTIEKYTHHGFCLFVVLMLAILLHVLSRLLPSRLLTLPKISENLEISIISQKTMRMESETGTTSMPVAKDQGTDESTADQGAHSSTASSLSASFDMAESGRVIETPRSLTPESSDENEDSPSPRKSFALSAVWTEQSEKVRGEGTDIIPSSY